jgi:hypothetical protein
MLVANPCTQNTSPKLYSADSTSDIAFIRNAKQGDLVIVATQSSWSVWKFYSEYSPSGSAIEGEDYIIAKPCGWFVLSGDSLLSGSGGVSLPWFVVDDVNELRQIPSSAANRMARLIRPNPGEIREWYWDSLSMAVDDGTDTSPVILPDGADAGDPGRWLPW